MRSEPVFCHVEERTASIPEYIDACLSGVVVLCLLYGIPPSLSLCLSLSIYTRRLGAAGWTDGRTDTRDTRAPHHHWGEPTPPAKAPYHPYQSIQGQRETPRTTREIHYYYDTIVLVN